MARSKTATSTPRLSEYARLFVYPDGIHRTVWTRVEAKAAELGIEYDWWQKQLGTVVLGYGENGKYVATVGGVGMSIPRQTGKTFMVLSMIVVMCILFPGLQVVWTSHHLQTSARTFRALKGICRNKLVAAHIEHRGIRSGKGEASVTFRNGSLIMFGARSTGYGRGFENIDIEVFDEAQILETRALEDMVAATNQAKHEHGALIIYMGTPPRPIDPSEAFLERRQEAWGGEAESAIWLEIGADPDSDPNDRTQWPLMNPSYPKRTPLESMLRLRKNLKSLDSWNREGRGVFDDTVGGALTVGTWLALKDPAAQPVGEHYFGFELTEREVWIAVAYDRADGDVQVMLANDGEPLPVRHAVAEGALLYEQFGGTFATSALAQELRDEGAEVVEMTSRDFAIASGAIADDIREGTIHHADQEALNEAVKAAKWDSPLKPSNERPFVLKDMPHVGPLGAAARALFAHDNAPPMPSIR